jgi:hypothetical protein
MSKDQADQSTTAATAAGAVPGGPAPLLRTLGDVNAAVCTDGFCEVPPRQEMGPVQETTPGDDGSHE